MTESQENMEKDAENTELVALNLRNVPRSLRNRFKAVCGENEQTMTETIIEFMELAVNKRITFWK